MPAWKQWQWNAPYPNAQCGQHEFPTEAQALVYARFAKLPCHRINLVLMATKNAMAFRLSLDTKNKAGAAI